jgi:hypothetical protein
MLSKRNPVTKLTLTTVALAIVALAPTAADGAPKPKPGGATLSLTAAPNPVVAGRRSVLSGRLTGPKNAGKTVTLGGSAYPFTANNNKIATTVTDAAGNYSFGRRPQLLTRYFVRVGKLSSPTVSVSVRHRVSLYLSDSTPKRGQLVRFSGRSCPEHDGVVVSIQRRLRTGAYRTVRRTRLRSASRCSVYHRRLRVYRDGVFRTVVAADADHLRGFSRRRAIDARR